MRFRCVTGPLEDCAWFKKVLTEGFFIVLSENLIM